MTFDELLTKVRKIADGADVSGIDFLAILARRLSLPSWSRSDGGSNDS